MKKVLLGLAVALLVATPATAQQTFTRSGRIVSIVTSNPGNAPFRVYLDPD